MENRNRMYAKQSQWSLKTGSRLKEPRRMRCRTQCYPHKLIVRQPHGVFCKNHEDRKEHTKAIKWSFVGEQDGSVECRVRENK